MQTASKRFAGRKKKEIKSYTRNTALDIESGESVDYLQAAIESTHRPVLGRSAKFGASVLLNPPVKKEKIGDLLDKIQDILQEGPRFSLPRTVLVSDQMQISQYDDLLVEAILRNADSTSFTHTGHDLVGVDFVFSGDERYTLSCRGHESWELGDDDLDIPALRNYAQSEKISPESILGVRVKVENEGQRSYSKPLKEALDFIVEGQNIMLSQGKWVQFNEDYVTQLKTAVDGIEIEPTEPAFQEIGTTETDFNDLKLNPLLASEGYTVADKDFSKIKTTLSTPVEAWDLRRGDTVFAVKFGTSQKVGYVCDQAIAVLEILRNNANVKKLDRGWKAYCLWLGLQLASTPTNVSDLNSIILLQKIDTWSRLCRGMGITPKIKLSRRT